MFLTCAAISSHTQARWQFLIHAAHYAKHDDKQLCTTGGSAHQAMAADMQLQQTGGYAKQAVTPTGSLMQHGVALNMQQTVLGPTGK